MKEIQLVIIRHNVLNQYTTYNYPLLTKVTEMQLEYTIILSINTFVRCLRIFEKLYSNMEATLPFLTNKEDFQLIEVRDVSIFKVVMIVCGYRITVMLC